MSLTDFILLLPVITLLVWAIALLVVDLWVPKGRKGITAALAALGLAVSLGLNLAQAGVSGLAFQNMVIVDSFAVYFNALYLVSGLVVVALSHDYLKRMNLERGEFYPLMLFSISGMMLLTEAYNLIMVFLALEFLSIPLYIMAGLARDRQESEESSLKYFLLGTFSSAFVLYGIALIFGATATTSMGLIVLALQEGAVDLPFFIAGAALLLVGFVFKLAAAPFHEWAPDVYQGAPTPVASFMAVAVKAAGVAVLLRVFLTVFPNLADVITPIGWGIAALTMLVGNVLAVAQTNLKRLLAYSSISHGGYLLMAFVAYGNPQVAGQAVSAMLFYLLAYALTTFGAWAVVISVEQSDYRGLELDDYAGLGLKYPWLGAAMLVFMLSLTGIPLTMGFWGKLFLFRTAVDAGYLNLALIGLLSSLISAYYYLRVVMTMYMRSGEPKVRRDAWLSLVAVGSALAVVLLSLLPNQMLQMAAQAVLRLQ
ncbi:MAG: NADH-quinone oxidoreductase subunit N [Chloroflexota bacterium]|jgi:NADH-quinone oxidoreductase subunit N